VARVGVVGIVIGLALEFHGEPKVKSILSADLSQTLKLGDAWDGGKLLRCAQKIELQGGANGMLELEGDGVANQVALLRLYAKYAANFENIHGKGSSIPNEAAAREGLVGLIVLVF
jgi:hypothetical protein